MSTTTVARTACKYPGCGQPAAPAAGTGRPPEYCAGRGHTRVSAWRERRRLAAGQAGTTISPAEDGSPLTTARMTGVELLRSLRAEADRITALGAGLRERIDTLTDPTAAEAEVEAVRAAAAEARAAAAEQRAATADQLRAEADAAAEEMSEHLTAAQALTQAAGQRAAPPSMNEMPLWHRPAPRLTSESLPPKPSGTPPSPRPALRPGSVSVPPSPPTTRPGRRQPTPRRPPGRPSRRPPVPRPLPAPPRPRPSGSAPMPGRYWTRCAPRRPANAMSCAPTCAPAPSAPNARRTPIATNSASSAPPAQVTATAAVQRPPKTTRRAARTPAT